jgi:SNF2 family DNA or RNA helicase
MKISKMNLRCGRGTKPVRVGIDEKNIFFSFSYSPLLVKAMKEFEHYKYYGFPDARLREYVLEHFKTDKVWSAKITQRNLFFFDYLRGNNPYDFFRQPWEPLESRYPLWDHQSQMSGFMLMRKRCILAGDMAVGKTLSLFAAMEKIAIEGPWLYVCPRYVKNAIEGEIAKWEPSVVPDEIISYQRLRIRMRKGEIKSPPQVLVCDEAHGLKDPTSLQTRAAQKLANWGREVWGDQFYCILMSGTPSPQEPSDWWSLCEIVQPGYLKAINVHRLRDQLAVMEINDYGHGEVKEVKQWLDRDGLCASCGKKFSPDQPKGPCAAKCFRPCCENPTKAKNEVKELYSKLENRLTYFVRKSEVMDLPELKKEIITIQPSDEVMDLARGYIAVSEGGADALNILRQVSDGFRYENVVVGEKQCDCQDGLVLQHIPVGDFLPPKPDDMTDKEYVDKYFELQEVSCQVCFGSGIVTETKKQANFFGSPKYDAVKELLKEYEEHGRAVLAAGFKGTVDHLTEVVEGEGWEWIRCDGRGWKASFPIEDDGECLYQFNRWDRPKLCLIGNPASIGAGFNLQISRCIIVVSNSFNAKDRIQLENRIHRAGMDRELGGRIYDIYYLPSDEYTMQKVEIKRARQDLSMGLDVDMDEIEKLFGVDK